MEKERDLRVLEDQAGVSSVQRRQGRGRQVQMKPANDEGRPGRREYWANGPYLLLGRDEMHYHPWGRDPRKTFSKLER